MLRALADREHPGVADRPKLVVDDDTAIDSEASVDGESDLRPDTACDHDDVRGEDRAVTELETGDPLLTDDGDR